MKASNAANNISIDINIIDIELRFIRNVIAVDNEKIKPIPWANLLGGPGTNFSLKFNLGTNNLVTKSANGLIFGPEETLAKKP